MSRHVMQEPFKHKGLSAVSVRELPISSLANNWPVLELASVCELGFPVLVPEASCTTCALSSLKWGILTWRLHQPAGNSNWKKQPINPNKQRSEGVQDNCIGSCTKHSKKASTASHLAGVMAKRKWKGMKRRLTPYGFGGGCSLLPQSWTAFGA